MELKQQDFLRTKLNCAIVFRGDIQEIQVAKKKLSELDIELIYQKISPLKLFIKEGGTHGD